MGIVIVLVVMALCGGCSQTGNTIVTSIEQAILTGIEHGIF